MSEIKVNFQAHGVSRVMEAFASIEKRAVQFQTKAIRAQQLLTSAVQREAGKQEKAVATSADREARAFEKESARMRKLAEKSANARTKAADKATKEVEKAAQRETRAFERESARLGRIAQRSADKRIQEATRAAKAEAEARKQFASGVSGKVVGATGRAVGTAANMAGGILALGGGFTFADATKTMMKNRGKAADIAIQSGGTIKKDELLNRASTTATAYGTSTENALNAVDRFYAKSGDAKMASGIMGDVLALATATGGDAGEIGEVGGQIAKADSNLTQKQVGDVMRGWAGQGRAGSVDMRELAQYGSRLAASAGLFSGDKASNMVSLGAVAQVATAGGASSAAEATEAAAQLGSDVWKHKDAFSQVGAFKDGKLVDPETLIKNAVFKTQGNRGKLQDMFGERSIKAVQGAANTYTDAYGAAKKGGANEKDARAAGEKAVNEAFDVFKKAALTDEQVKKDAAERLAEADKKLEGAMNDLKDKVGKELLPVVTTLVNELSRAVPDIVRFAKVMAELVAWVAKNPFSGLGALVAGLVTKDLLSAAIGAKVQEAITRLIAGGGGGGVPGAVPGAAGGGTAAGGAGGGLLASGVAGAAAGVALAAGTLYTGVNAASEGTKVGQGRVAGLYDQGATTLRRLKSGTIDVGAAKRAADLMALEVESAKENTSGARTLEAGAASMGTLVSKDARQTVGRYNENSVVAGAASDIMEMVNAIRKATAAAEGAAKGLNGVGEASSNADPNNPKNKKPMSSPDRH
ncbi:MAG: hypothetical protein U0169_02075 [Polyangiaceae bacterium]